MRKLNRGGGVLMRWDIWKRYLHGVTTGPQPTHWSFSALQMFTSIGVQHCMFAFVCFCLCLCVHIWALSCFCVNVNDYELWVVTKTSWNSVHTYKCWQCNFSFTLQKDTKWGVMRWGMRCVCVRLWVVWVHKLGGGREAEPDLTHLPNTSQPPPSSSQSLALSPVELV